MTQPGEGRESCDGQRDLDRFAYIFAHFHDPSSFPDATTASSLSCYEGQRFRVQSRKVPGAGVDFANGSVPASLKRLSKIISSPYPKSTSPPNRCSDFSPQRQFLHLHLSSVCSFANEYSYLLMIFNTLLLSVAEVVPLSWIDR